MCCTSVPDNSPKQRKRMIILALVSLFALFDDCVGDCVWYGQCGYQGFGHKLNCKYTGPPKPFSTLEGLQKFKEYCPSLYTGSNVRTCCSDDQMLTLDTQMGFSRQLLQQCPSCFYNFMNLWCYLTCGPNQDEYMSVNATKPYVTPKNETVEAVISVNYAVETDSAHGMFNSCRDVQSYNNLRALSFLCGEDAETCTPQRWLDYMGNSLKSEAPFDIYFSVSSRNVTINNTVLVPLDMKPVPCYKAVSSTSKPCRCTDCPKASCDFVLPTVSPLFRTENIIIRRPKNSTRVPWINKNFTSIFDITFMHQILDLQLSITNLTAEYRNENITLEDICYAPLRPDNNNCTVMSIFNYYQNSHEMLDKVALDDYGWFVVANYLDHFLYCVWDPAAAHDASKLRTPCLGTFGGPVYPSLVLRDYEGQEYWTAKALVITFDVLNGKKVKAWEKRFYAFMKEYKTLNKDLDITYFSKVTTPSN
ncbi:Niemann-Pick C1 protein-like isoform X2 [Biomphalaria pfeifferi]|uniref:Niemann-Pick C1 protein-like isoform X2 n=1 Tax=Biomphalaria pfeifferi TaxID=112525 RepID=A0AAD8C4G6_BIOPF|nr:Niemann-Pick C1 protein-like isoform X2 [Biomphalaria pfeifferi]